MCSSAEASPITGSRPQYLPCKTARTICCAEMRRGSRAKPSARSLRSPHETLAKELAVVYEGHSVRCGMRSAEPRENFGERANPADEPCSQESVTRPLHIRAVRLGTDRRGNRDCAARNRRACRSTESHGPDTRGHVRPSSEVLGNWRTLRTLGAHSCWNDSSSDEFRPVLAARRFDDEYRARLLSSRRTTKARYALLDRIANIVSGNLCPEQLTTPLRGMHALRIRSRGYRPSDADMNDLIAQHRGWLERSVPRTSLCTRSRIALEARGERAAQQSYTLNTFRKYRRESASQYYHSSERESRRLIEQPERERRLRATGRRCLA